MSDHVELPSSWIRLRLGDVVNYGETEKAEPTELKANDWILELEDIERDTSKILHRLTFAERNSKSTKTRFMKGDVLYGKLRPYLNKVVIADYDGYCTTEIIPLKANIAVFGYYLFYWLKNPQFVDYTNSVSHGLNMPRLGTKAGQSAPFILAPYNEQKRIADKLDALLARVDACREHLERVPGILKRFRQAVLSAAVSGKLTEEWRKEQKLNNKWPLQKISAITSKVGSGATPRGGEKSYQSSGIPFIRSMNVVFYGFKRNGLAFLDNNQANELRNVEVKSNDILLNITGASIGRVTLAPSDMEGARVNQHVCIIRPTEVVKPEYLSAYLSSPSMQQVIGAENYGVTRQALTKEQILNFEIPLPLIEEQHEIVRRVEALFAYADRLESRYEAARTQVDDLTPALLAKAFRGELVPQDPNDEPASVLLERIRAERGTSP